MEKLAQISLRNDKTPQSTSKLDAYMEANGDLVLDGCDAGAHIKQQFDDYDYEYTRRVRARHVPQLLLELIKDRFASDVEFADWLTTKNIPDEFESWI